MIAVSVAGHSLVSNLVSVAVPCVIGLAVVVRNVLRRQDEHDAALLDADRKRARP